LTQTWEMTLPAQQLIELVRPFEVDVWVGGVVSAEDVAWALDDGRLSEIGPGWDWNTYLASTAQDHAERIAWLVTYGWDPDEPLVVVVNTDGVVTMEDGNHRLHALAYLGAAVDVLVQVCGYMEVVEDVFNVCLHEEVGWC
jgi:hypothetical protein